VTRVAAVDCGTNTIKLLVADLDPVTGEERELVRESRMVRLGQGVDRSGRLADEALARVFGAVEEFAALVAPHQVERIRFCATSAARDAENADVFRAGVEERLGVLPEVVSGAEEAVLSFTGAVRPLAASPGGGEVPGPVLVVDIGGGSTELVLGDVDPATGRAVVEVGHSVDVGSVRMTERRLHSDPPTGAEVQAARDEVDAALDVLPGRGVRLERARSVVTVSGTGLTVAATALDLDGYDRHRLDGAQVPTAELRAAVARLLGMTVAERRALPYMHPGRADVIGAGALVLDAVLRRTGVPVVRVSVHDILDGIAWSLA
jgi:exopolyphosphatase/guanosine-5'-triphosphate,3'-diphosphate pyrophosphatase